MAESTTKASPRAQATGRNGDGDTPAASTRIRVPKTSELVADQIRGQIVRGELGEGASLPPEGQLMASLGISRPTLREAFRILEAENLISVVRGSRSGARVNRPAIELVSRYSGYYLQSIGTTVADLYQARLAIEPQVVRWLAARPSREPVARLRAGLASLQALLDDHRHDEFLDQINSFHSLLVEVTGNNTLTFMNRVLLALVARHQDDHVRRLPRPDENREKRLVAAQRSYIKLVDLIEAGEEDAAVRHWRLHLNNANETWSGGSEGERVVDALSR